MQCIWLGFALQEAVVKLILNRDASRHAQTISVPLHLS
jgi:hypothetical protein